MRRRWSATVSWAVILAVAVGLDIVSAQGSDPRGESDFVSQAAMSNMVAIQLGHMATKKAQNAVVQKFAQATIDEHLKAQQQLLEAAQGAGIRWPTKLDDRNRQLQQRLSKLSNAQFDREYMRAMIDRHRDVEKALAARVNAGSVTSSQSRPAGDASSLTAKVNKWAERMLPEVQAHLEEAEQVFKGLGQAE